MTRAGVVAMSLLLVLYLAFTMQYAVIMITDGHPILIVLGVALAVLPLLGAWGLFVEVRFMLRAQRLARRLEREGALPADAVPLQPSGRPDRAAADALFPKFREAVEAEPDSWRAWFRLGIVYDAAGDRKRARHATRRAIELARAEGAPAR
ncbi:hypothetical protein [Ruicaihuangia caeni]|uniref:hypothetical protein n=1 Tax=Ruicaihuangia caeni TaxID=3042517 RepID=UPI00338DCD20